MRKIELPDAEAAVANVVNYRRQIKEMEAKMNENSEIVELYAREHVEEFEDDILPCGIGLIQIKAGAAKPITDGRALKKAERMSLALALPARYVSLSIDSKALYECQDKVVRQLLQSKHIEIVREDKYVVV